MSLCRIFCVGPIRFQQYLNIVRLIHLELGLKNPLKENWFASSVLSGIQRGKGASQYYKLSVDISMLCKFHQKLSHIDWQIPGSGHLFYDAVLFFWWYYVSYLCYVYCTLWFYRCV